MRSKTRVLVDELFLTAVRFSENGESASVQVRIDPHLAERVDVYFSALEMVVHNLNDTCQRCAAEIPQRPLEETPTGFRYGKDHPLADLRRELTQEEAEDMRHLIELTAGRLIQYGREPQPIPLKNGRRLAYIKHVVCVNPNDWKNPPLYIPEPHGVHMHERRLATIYGRVEWLLDFQGQWIRSFKDTLQAYREKYGTNFD